MDLHYTIWNPTNNTTMLVDSPVPRSQQSEIAARLMAAHSAVEQVGFIERPQHPDALLRLQMMGGEFCGNASMSAAAFAAKQDGCSSGTIPLEVSGYDGLLNCQLNKIDGLLYGTVSMPLPEKVATADLPEVGTVPAVFFSGIVHCIVPVEAMTRAQAESAIRPFCAALGADACGILLYDKISSEFTPLVYVASTDTAVWESGCGSGSAAIGSFLAVQEKSDCSRDLRQPGGMITVSAQWNGGKIHALTITGQIDFVDSGSCIL